MSNLIDSIEKKIISGKEQRNPDLIDDAIKCACYVLAHDDCDSVLIKAMIALVEIGHYLKALSYVEHIRYNTKDKILLCVIEALIQMGAFDVAECFLAKMRCGLSYYRVATEKLLVAQA